MGDSKTSICVSRETWRRLNALRTDPLETMNNIIEKSIALLEKENKNGVSN